MDYYTRTTFEFQSSLLGAQSGVGGGGRYDGLVEAIGGPSTPGVGFGTGVERILLALARSGVQAPAPEAPIVYLVGLTPEGRAQVFALAHELRTLGASADLDYMSRSAKGQMKQAGRSGAKYAFIVGEQELADDVVTVRDMQSGEERALPRDEAVALATMGTPAI
jgi:histidyl-tRNA synthetase